MLPVGIDDIRAARQRVSAVAVETPLLPWRVDFPGNNLVWLKAECLQPTGSFKIRGARNAIASLSQDERQRGVITYSSGNHGQAVAFAARVAGINAVVVMPGDAVSFKVEATKRWGAAVAFAGNRSQDRQEMALDLAQKHGYTVIPPFDDRRIIAGQGTAGLEIAEQLPDVEAVLVPVGGGGLLSGVATAIKSLKPDVRIIGVEPEGAADVRDSLAAGEPTRWEIIDTVADGLRTSQVGDLNFEAIRELVDLVVTVTDAEILETVGLLAKEAKLIAEPSGAVAPAAALFGRTGLSDARLAAIVSGGNIDPAQLAACVQTGVTSAS
ncbi:MAG: threonine ammonia-lyase [Chloroflexota bacterium]